MSKHELTEADLIRLIGNPLIPESVKDTYKKKLKIMRVEFIKNIAYPTWYSEGDDKGVLEMAAIGDAEDKICIIRVINKGGVPYSIIVENGCDLYSAPTEDEKDMLDYYYEVNPKHKGKTLKWQDFSLMKRVYATKDGHIVII